MTIEIGNVQRVYKGILRPSGWGFTLGARLLPRVSAPQAEPRSTLMNPDSLRELLTLRRLNLGSKIVSAAGNGDR
jgi:hypothetical protein